MTTTFETAKVGDRVFSLVAGWTEISKLDVGMNYPITVQRVGDQFPCEAQFLLNGKLRDSGEQILFWDEIKFDVPKKPVEVPAKDTVVRVRQNTCTSWQLRHTTGSATTDGFLYCYNDGRSSKTVFSEQDKYPWKLWEVVD